MEATGLEVELRAEGVALADLDGDCTDLGLPEEGTEGHLTLLHRDLAGRSDQGRGRCNGPCHRRSAAPAKTARFIRRHRHHWRKEVAEKGAEAWLASEIVDRLAGLGLVKRLADGIRPLPALGRFGYRETDESARISEEQLPLMPREGSP